MTRRTRIGSRLTAGAGAMGRGPSGASVQPYGTTFAIRRILWATQDDVSPAATSPSVPSTSAPATVTIIRPTSGFVPPRLTELWRYRELLAFLIWRDVKVRYAQTLLGGVWTIFQPLALM